MNNLVSSDMPIEKRMASDEVEKKFENWFFNKNRESDDFCFKYGLDWNNTQGKNVKNLKGIILNTPDYICYNANQNMYYFTEVKHCGKFLHLKHEHFKNYKSWTKVYDLRFWIYNKSFVSPTALVLEETIVQIRLCDLEDLINKNDYKVTTWSKEKDDPNDCKKPMWKIPFWDIYESM